MRTYLVVFLCLCSSVVFSQGGKIGIISGAFLDSISGTPLEYASFRLFSVKDSAVVAGIYTDEKGEFTLDQLPLGKYYAKVTYLAYPLKMIPNIVFTMENPSVNLGNIKWKKDASLELNEVQVVASQDLMTTSLDKKVYNVGEDLATKGGSVNDVLNNVPSVEIDQDGKISLRGDGNVTILIDGRPSTLTGSNGKSLLDALPANSIERIEIVTNPSAKYDPDGTSGIINIVLKKNKLKGVNGAVSVSAGTGNDYNAAASLSLRNAKYNVYGTYAYSHYEGTRNFENLLRRTIGDSIFELDQDRKGTDLMENHTAKVGVDFYLKKRQTLGIGITGTTGKRERTGDLINVQSDQTDQIVRLWERISDDPTQNKNMDLNLNYNFDFKAEKGSLAFNFTQSFGDESAKGFYNESYISENGNPSVSPALIQRLANTEINKVTTFQLDYVKHLPKSVRIDAGVKAIVRSSSVSTNSQTRDNSTNLYFADTLSNFDYIYKGQIYSAYTSLAHQYKKWKYQAGLRYEYAVQDPQLVSENKSYTTYYTNLFPSAFLKYELSKKSEFSLSYSKRINRPSDGNLNPFTSYADPFNLRKGNPELTPEYIHSFDLGYGITTKSVSFTSSVFFRNTLDNISRIKLYYDNGTTASSYANIDGSKSLGAEIVLIYKPVTWFKNMLSANGNQVNYSNTAPGTNWNNSGFMWGAKYAGTVDFWKKTASVQVNVRYNSPFITPQGIALPRWSMDLSGDKTLKNNKWTIGFRLTDVFNTREFNIEVDQDPIYQEMRFKQLTRRFYLNVSYKFGKYEVTKKAKVSGGNGSGGGED